MGIRAGIDLGTTFSAVAYIEPGSGKAEIIENSFGSPTTPSVLYFEENGNVLFGEEAEPMKDAGDPNAVAFFKRSMGKDGFLTEIRGKTYNATDLSAIFLEKLAAEASRQLGEEISEAVITVPAYFTHKERKATVEAGKRAGLNVISIINEPTAAAFAYGINERGKKQTVLIYDLGGGTFDVTIARVDSERISIVGSDGDHDLGGKDWDDCIAGYLANEFYAKYGIDIREDELASQDVSAKSERVKKQLTSMDSVCVPMTCGNTRGEVFITQEIFEEISAYLLCSTRDVVDRLFLSVGMSWSDIDETILVGGSTRMRAVKKYVREMSGKEPAGGVDPDAAVALGAAIRANITPEGDAVPILRAGGQKDIPIIRGAKAYNDVTAHSLGMISESEDGSRYINSTIIRKNTWIPASDTRPFAFVTDGEDSELLVYVLQGDFERPLDNVILNRYVITGMEDIGETVIEDGVVEVSAYQRENGRELIADPREVPEDMSWTDGAPPKKHAEGMDIILCIDLSASMNGAPIREAKKAMTGFVNDMSAPNVRFGLIPFATKAVTVLSLTDNADIAKKRIESLAISFDYGYGTEAQPFDEAMKEFEWSANRLRYMVVLTDGVWEDTETALIAAEKCRKQGIEIMALGFGDADAGFLKSIASTDEFADLTDLSGLGVSFSKIARAISESL